MRILEDIWFAVETERIGGDIQVVFLLSCWEEVNAELDLEIWIDICFYRTV